VAVPHPNSSKRQTNTETSPETVEISHHAAQLVFVKQTFKTYIVKINTSCAGIISLGKCSKVIQALVVRGKKWR